MKKLILIVLVLFSVFTNAQHSKEQTQIIRVSTNPKIVFCGAYESDTGGGDFSATISWVLKFKSRNEAGITVEYTALNPYFFATGFIYNHDFDIFYSNFIETKIGVEALLINRGKAYHRSKQFFVTGGVNAIMNFNISDLIQLGLRLNLKYRPDLVELWNGKKTSYGGFINIGFKFH